MNRRTRSINIENRRTMHNRNLSKQPFASLIPPPDLPDWF